MTTPTDVEIRTYGSGHVEPLLDTLVGIWSDAHPELTGPAGADTPGTGTSGLSAVTLRRQILGHAVREGFTLVTAHHHGTTVGFGYAFPCEPSYWFGPELLPRITGPVRSGRLMGLCELAVLPSRQSRGIGSRLHAELLKAIDPEWSSLLVRPDNPRGRGLYDRLGYTYAGPYRNTADGPEYDLLLLEVGRDGPG
ncbi:GNAT family N-acetyltransferase [Streptomyces sp. SID3212]|uniref:GNAT family N-acetyltransferase n=1 Tax=Streptomyces sp. SID3212 TaxID=2690259 RepID=UPI00136D164E|nr:GNAT family N-acetyltransferase [Streptomyces sp. SID3212]